MQAMMGSVTEDSVTKNYLYIKVTPNGTSITYWLANCYLQDSKTNAIESIGSSAPAATTLTLTNPTSTFVKKIIPIESGGTG
jgi:hypothetical protein